MGLKLLAITLLVCSVVGAPTAHPDTVVPEETATTTAKAASLVEMKSGSKAGAYASAEGAINFEVVEVGLKCVSGSDYWNLDTNVDDADACQELARAVDSSNKPAYVSYNSGNKKCIVASSCTESYPTGSNAAYWTTYHMYHFAAKSNSRVATSADDYEQTTDVESYEHCAARAVLLNYDYFSW